MSDQMSRAGKWASKRREIDRLREELPDRPKLKDGTITTECAASGGFRLWPGDITIPQESVGPLRDWLTDTFAPPVEPVLTEEEEKEFRNLMYTIQHKAQLTRVEQSRFVNYAFAKLSGPAMAIIPHSLAMKNLLGGLSGIPTTAEPAQSAPEMITCLNCEMTKTERVSRKLVSAPEMITCLNCDGAGEVEAEKPLDQAPPATSEEDRELQRLLVDASKIIKAIDEYTPNDYAPEGYNLSAVSLRLLAAAAKLAGKGKM